MRRILRAEIIVDPGENSMQVLADAVARYFESRGFKVVVPHVYPENPIVIECVETIPKITF